MNLNAVLLGHAENIIESYVQWKNRWIPMLQYEYHGRKWSDVTTCQGISWYDKRIRPEHFWHNKGEFHVNIASGNGSVALGIWANVEPNICYQIG